MPLSQTLANNQNEINKLIRQRQEALDQTVDDLIATDFLTPQSFMNAKK